MFFFFFLLDKFDDNQRNSNQSNTMSCSRAPPRHERRPRTSRSFWLVVPAGPDFEGLAGSVMCRRGANFKPLWANEMRQKLETQVMFKQSSWMLGISGGLYINLLGANFNPEVSTPTVAKHLTS